MTKAQTITIRLSECRQKINDLLGVETRSDEQQADLEKLTGEVQKLEPELRAAIAAEPDPVVDVTDTTDPEVRERLELRSKASLGGFLLAALQGRMPAGAEHEYAAAFDAKPGHVPMDLWEADRPAPETRATTPAPTTGTGVSVAPVQPFVFAPSIAPRLGIDMPSVGSGGYAEMTITTALPAAPKEKGGDADDTAGALTAVTTNNRRISARMSVTLEDVAAIGVGNFEAALRQNVSMALSNEYDDQVINGNGTAPNIQGLIAQLDNPEDPTALATFDGFLRAFSDQIDGLWASMVSHVSLVANVDAYKLSARTFRDSAGANPNDLGDTSFADYAMAHTGGWWTNKRMPATASTLARAIVYRKGRTGLRTACHPTWGTVSIDDIYTSSRSGQRHFTIHALVGDKVLLVQPDAYDLAEFKVA
ncbi:MAG: phage major capsid protein [Acidobacteria bacterium]|nr:phage major capsid protein [Acidobacteriota bacterium]